MIKVTELEPCPFCGCENMEFQDSGFGEPPWVHITCGRCATSSGASKTVALAVERWNTRAMRAKEAPCPDERPPIMLQIAAAGREQEMWERRFRVLYHSHPSWRSADNDGPWGLRDFLRYAGEVCGFDVEAALRGIEMGGTSTKGNKHGNLG